MILWMGEQRQYIIILALELPTHFFSSTLVDFDVCTVRFLHALPCEFQEGGKESNHMPIRVGEHTKLIVVFLNSYYWVRMELKGCKANRQKEGKFKKREIGWT